MEREMVLSAIQNMLCSITNRVIILYESDYFECYLGDNKMSIDSLDRVNWIIEIENYYKVKLNGDYVVVGDIIDDILQEKLN